MDGIPILFKFIKVIEPNTNRSNMHYIDHIVIGIHDLEKGIASIEKLTGVKPVPVVNHG
jgi:hypothetical protein